MNLLTRFSEFSLHCSKYSRLFIVNSVQVAQCVRRPQTTATSSLKKTDVIANICQKFNCTESSAKNIYNKFPSLRSINAIKNETLDLLRDNVSSQTIVENPSLVLMEVGMESFILYKKYGINLFIAISIIKI